MLRQISGNGVSSVAATARALATYSLVPYLGVLFCPGAMVLGGFGVVRSYQLRDTTDRSVCYLSVSIGLIVLLVQLMLWWILYRVPAWARGM
ncbi:MAG: hypothetical protein ABR555_01650 [Pyrinomonadaceae bacterium]